MANSASHTALYRRYRPVTFEQVIGQEHVTVPLIQALKNGKLNHAYLFSGPRGCGKTSSARILARSLNCVDGPTPTPCGSCESCQALAPDGPGSLDVIEIDAASHGGVDDARELRERAFFAPVNSRFKVYVIDEAHMVSSAGFNALLKLVEEPPDFVTFVFATTEPEKVLQTIRSRTHHYPFRLVPPAALRAHLEQICTTEGVLVEPTVFPLVVRAGGGSVRDSLSILDQLLAGAGDQGVTYQRAVALLGVTDTALIDQLCDGLAAADGAAVFATIDKVVEAGHDPRRFAADLLERLRDLVILANVPNAAAKGLVNAPPDQLATMTAQTLRLGAASVSRMADVVHEGLLQMRGTTSARLLLELTCARALLPSSDEGHSALLQRLERLERRAEVAEVQPLTPPPAIDSAPPAPIAVAPPPPPPAQTVVPSTSAVDLASEVALNQPVPTPLSPTQTKPTGDLDLSDVRRIWPELLEKVKAKRRVVWMLLQNANPAVLSGEELVLTVAHQGLLQRFTDDTVVEVIAEALQELLGVRWRISAKLEESTSGGQSSASPAPPTSTVPVPFKPAISSRSVPETVTDPEPSPGKDTPATTAPTSANAGTDVESAALEILRNKLGARKISEFGS